MQISRIARHMPNVWRWLNRAQSPGASVYGSGRASSRAVNVGPGAGRVMAGRDGRVGGRDARQGRTTVTLEGVARAAGVRYPPVARALDPTAVPRGSAVPRGHTPALPEQRGYHPG